jgi:hypothetical protein
MLLKLASTFVSNRLRIDRPPEPLCCLAKACEHLGYVAPGLSQPNVIDRSRARTGLDRTRRARDTWPGPAPNASVARLVVSLDVRRAVARRRGIPLCGPNSTISWKLNRRMVADRNRLLLGGRAPAVGI